MKVRVGINGLGNIGRRFLKAAWEHPEIEVVAANDFVPTESIAHLIKYDSNYGIWSHQVAASEKEIVIDGRPIRVFTEKEPGRLPWGELGVDIVIESTGKFKEKETASAHLVGGARKVIISAPATNEDITIVMGVNEDKYDPASHHIVSNASCTTNCLAPMAKVLDDSFGIHRGLMTTVHAYTADQNLLDAGHKDLRRARAAAQSIIPTSTGAAKAIGLVLPHLKGRLNGTSVRVPTPVVSLTDLVAELERPASAAEINLAMKEAAEGRLKGIIEYCDAPLVSVDFKGNPHSSIFDATQTMVVEGGLAKIMAWYDNEWGYCNRLVDLAVYMASRGF